MTSGQMMRVSVRTMMVLPLLLGGVNPCHTRAMAAVAQQQRASAAARPLTVATEEPKIEPRARQLLEQMAGAYASLNSYSGAITVRDDSQPGAGEQRVTIALRKPDRVAIVTRDKTGGWRRVVSDGKHLYLVSSQDTGHYRKRSLQPRVPGFYQALSVGGNKVSGALFLGQSPYQGLHENVLSLRVGPPGTVSGVAVETVTATLKSPPGLSATYAIGKSDHLLRRLVLSGTVKGKTGKHTETHSNIQANPPLPPSLFRFTPPPGSEAVSFEHPGGVARR